MNSLRKVFGQSFGSLTLAFPLSPRLGGRRTPPTRLQAYQVALYELTEPQTLLQSWCPSLVTLYSLWLLFPIQYYHSL